MVSELPVLWATPSCWSSGSLRFERRRTLVRESGHGAGVADGVVGVWQVREV